MLSAGMHPVCGELLIFHRNQQFATHRSQLPGQTLLCFEHWSEATNGLES
jgi:hypothetical protein